MNHIILSDSVGEKLEGEYQDFWAECGYVGTFDSYLDYRLSFDGCYRLADRRAGANGYQLIGKQCKLFMEVEKSHPDWFYARNIVFFDSEKEYSRSLSQTIELPGEWSAVLRKDAHGLSAHGVTDISAVLSKVRASDKEYKAFQKIWETWDIYNTKRREWEEKQEAEAERAVKKVIVENDIFTLVLESISDRYKQDETVYVGQEKGNFFPLGKIAAVRKRTCEVDVVCGRHDFVMDYHAGRVGRICRCTVVDAGSKAKLRRQKEAMERLFYGASANVDMKDILLGEFEWDESGKDGAAMKEMEGLFHLNARQRKACAGAAHASDIYMIQGPPGTGKTTVIAEMVRYAAGQGKKVLVSSETHVAVDNALERICHTENVIPVRYGKKEKIGEYCQKYMPEEIADTVLQRARQISGYLDEHGVNPKALAEQCREKWHQKQQALEKEIGELEMRLGLRVEQNYEKLLRKIQKFEALAVELNDQYEQIRREKDAYGREREGREKLLEEKARLEERIFFLENSTSSGMRKASASQNSEVGALRVRLQKIMAQAGQVEQSLAKNKYEVLTASYQRGLRRYERTKGELAEILPPSGSVAAKAHQTMELLEDIFSQQRQREEMRLAMEEEVNSIQKDCERKERIWALSKDIRAEWMEATKSQAVREDVEHVYLRRTNAVFSTCTGIASSEDDRIANMDYDYVIIDEAAKCNALDLLIPLTRGKKVILVGDHKQLAPMLEEDWIEGEMSAEQIKELKEHILFKHLYEEIVPAEYKIMLNQQYRMEKSISKFVSDRFYGGKLQCEKDKENPSSMVWIDCERSKEEHVGKSYRNPEEAEVILRLLSRLDAEYAKGIPVGVICAYRPQAEEIKNSIRAKSWKNIDVECDTVDAFQGKEKHTIIFNVVRSQKLTEFAKDENRVNVAVSRAREYLYVIGSAELVKRTDAGVLRELYEYIRKQGGIYASAYAAGK